MKQKIVRLSFFFYILFFSINAFSQGTLNNGLLAYYPFTGNANDISGNNNNAVNNGATPTSDRFGNINSAYRFNGTNNFMRVANSASLQVGNQISVCAWVQPRGFYTLQCANNMIVMKGGEYTPNNFYLRFADITTGCTNPNFTNQQFYGGSNATGAIAALPIVQLNNWYSLVWTYDGANIRIYVNCILRQTISVGNLIFNNAADLFIGQMNNPQYPFFLNGDLDELRIYNRPLNQAEVNLYGGCAIPTPCPIDTSVTITKCQNQNIILNSRQGNTYSWSPATGLSSSNIQSPSCFAAFNTNYVVTITNTTTNCTYRDTIKVIVNPPSFSNLRDTAICNGDTLQLFAPTGNIYNWAPAININNTTISNPLVWPTTTMDYNVTITNNFGCVYKDTVRINVNECGCQDTCNWSLTGNSSIKPENFIGSRNNEAFKIRTNNLQRAIVTATGDVGIGTNTPTKKLDINGEVVIRSLPNASPNDKLLFANSLGELKSLNAGSANQYLSGNGTWQNLPTNGGGGTVTNAAQGVTLENTTVQLGDYCGNGGGAFQRNREINLNNNNLYFNSSDLGKLFMGSTDRKGQNCKELFTRLEIASVGLTEPENGYVSPQPSTSGLRFTNLTAKDAPVESRTNGVLSLDDDGDVIWVKSCCNVLAAETRMQEIINRLEVLEKELTATKTENALLKNKISQIDITLESKKDMLEQNVPNPFLETTTIGYTLISTFSKAEIIFTTLKGEIIKSVQLRNTGRGQINISANLIAKGIYNYSLIIDGKLIETKKMIKQ